MSDIPLPKLAILVSLSLSADKIALAFGVTPDKIRQLIDTSEELQALITKATAEEVQQDLNKHVTILSIEKKLLTQADLLAQDSESLGEVMGALHKLTVVKQLREEAGAQQADPGTTLDLTLSHIGQAQINISLTSNNQIQSIDGRSMAPMPYKAAMSLITKGKNGKQRYQDKQPLADALDIPDIESLERTRRNDQHTETARATPETDEA